jgi:hypothetical protein
MTGKATVTCAGTTCNDSQIGTEEFLAQSGACEGDSGGPAIDDAGAVFGIVSRSSSDCSRTAYLSLASHFTWLAQSARAAAELTNEPIPSWAELPELREPPAAPTSDPYEITSTAPPTLHAGGGCTMVPSTQSSAFSVLVLLGAWLASHKRRRFSVQ